MIVLFSGLPGTGKSTLANAVSKTYKFPLLARDSLQKFLYEREFIAGNTIDGYLLMLHLAEQFAACDVGVILDGTFPRHEFRAAAHKIATEHNLAFAAIHCVTSDRAVWRERWHTRKATGTSPSHWIDFTWDDVLRIEQSFEPWEQHSVLTLDAIQPVSANLDRLWEYLDTQQTTL